MNPLIYFTLFYILFGIAVSFIGLCWAGILLKEGNLFDWLVPYIRKIKNKQLKNLIQCHKCVSGQFGLWSMVIIAIDYGFPITTFTVFVFITWLAFVVVFTDWAYLALKLDQKPAVPMPKPVSEVEQPNT